MASTLIAPLQRLFWKSFFRLVVLTGAIAVWACAAWVLVVVAGVPIPWPVHLVAPFVLHLMHRRVFRIVGPRANASPARRSPAVRAWVGVVFTSLFAFVVLLANAAVWALVAAVLHATSGPVAAADVLGPAGFTGSLALVGVSSLIAWGYGPGQRAVRVVHLDVWIPGLPNALDGYRLAQVSDIHLGGYTGEDMLRRQVERINDLGVDAICITGDITDGLDHAPRTFPVLGELRARDGVFAILGNHDFYTGADDVEAALARFTGIRLLRDDFVTLRRGDARFHLLGVDDAGDDWTRGPREHPALPPLVARVPAGDAAVLLSHRPELFGQAASLGIGLVLSGHTHGGQLALPWPAARPSSLAHFISDYPRGTYRSGDSTLHVNLGLGVTGQPVRVFSPREITLVTLRSPESQPREGDPRC